MIPRLGCVPFLNAKPLIAWFSASDEPSADVVFDDPSALGPMVDRGEVDAAIASSFFAVDDPSFSIAAGVSISSNGPVSSVRLFSKVPFNEISSLALDKASMTSNHLARIILAKEHGVQAVAEPRKADLESMLQEFDAAVLIGDAGMTAAGEGLYALDLGEAWTAMTGKPFVWAFWVGRSALTADLANTLLRAKLYGMQEIETIARDAAQEMDIPFETAHEYLTKAIDFDLNEEHLGGFAAYGKLCSEMGFVEQFSMPRLVGDASAKAGAS